MSENDLNYVTGKTLYCNGTHYKAFMVIKGGMCHACQLPASSCRVLKYPCRLEDGRFCVFKELRQAPPSK